MDEQYLLVVNGKPEGPYSVAELNAKRIRPGDFVKTPSMNDYKEAHEVAELRALLGFRFQPVMPQYFGSFDQRLLATAIDWFLVAGAVIVPVCVFVLITDSKLVRIILSAGILILVPAAKLVYHVVMEGSSSQATFGKQILKIRVCAIDGTGIGYGQALGRNIAKVLSALPLGIGYLFAFFNKKQQCLHDRVAGTLVIKDRLF